MPKLGALLLERGLEWELAQGQEWELRQEVEQELEWVAGLQELWPCHAVVQVLQASAELAWI